MTAASEPERPTGKHPVPVDRAPELGRVVQVLVPVADVERAVAFYGEVLGLPLALRSPAGAWFDAAGTRVYLSGPAEPDFDGRATVYFDVAEVDVTLAAIEARGARVRQRPHLVHRDANVELWLAFVDDPDGNHVGLLEERRIQP